MNRAAFLDRDGIVNVDTGFAYRIEDIAFVEGMFDLCAVLVARGLELVVVTNQSGIARGYFTEQELGRTHAWMREEFRQRGTPLSGIYYCPHHPDGSVAVYRQDCDCRKPAPGMIRRAQRELALDLGGSLFIGDRDTDMQAARAAGVALRIRVAPQGDSDPAAHWVVSDLAELLRPPLLGRLERFLESSPGNPGEPRR